MQNIYPIIGMSPGNSYFNDEGVRFVVSEVIKRYGKAVVLIADIPAISTYVALGYSESEARNKAVPKGNNLKNRTLRIAKELALEDSIKVIDWEQEVEGNLQYQGKYQDILKLCETNEAFNNAARETTREVLQKSGRQITDMEAAITTANHYLLAEFAFLEFAPKFLGSESIVYVYHKPWAVYEDYIAGKFDKQTKPYLGFLLLNKQSV